MSQCHELVFVSISPKLLSLFYLRARARALARGSHAAAAAAAAFKRDTNGDDEQHADCLHALANEGGDTPPAARRLKQVSSERARVWAPKDAAAAAATWRVHVAATSSKNDGFRSLMRDVRARESRAR